MENSGKSRSLYCKRERKHSHENLENHSRPYRRRPCYRWDCRHSLGMRQEVSCPGKRAGNSPGLRRRRSQNRRPSPGEIPSQQSGGFLACRAGWWLCGGYKCFAKLVLREVSMILGMEKAGKRGFPAFVCYGWPVRWQRTVTRSAPSRVQVKRVRAQPPSSISSTAVAGRLSTWDTV